MQFSVDQQDCLLECAQNLIELSRQEWHEKPESWDQATLIKAFTAWEQIRGQENPGWNNPGNDYDGTVSPEALWEGKVRRKQFGRFS